MTVAVQTPSITYVENGGTTVFAVPFRYDSAADLRAVRRSPSGFEAELVNGIDFTATAGPTNAGGALTVTAAAPEGTVLTIFRDTTRAQEADYITSGAFTAESHERALDKAMLVAQEQDVLHARSLRAPVGESAPSLSPRQQLEGRLLGYKDGRIIGVPGDPMALGEAIAAVESLAALVMAGRSESFTQSFGPRVQAVVLSAEGVGEGGYFIEFAPRVSRTFTRVHARVFKGTGVCTLKLLAPGIIWQAANVGTVPVDQTVSLTTAADSDLVVLIENIIGDVQGVVVLLEEPIA
jgi:hypothetical protein